MNTRRWRSLGSIFETASSRRCVSSIKCCSMIKCPGDLAISWEAIGYFRESCLSKGQTLMAWRVRMEVVKTSIPDSSLKMCLKRCSTLLIVKRNANQNYNDISPHTGQSGHHQKIYKQKMLKRAWRKGDPLTLLMRTSILFSIVWRILLYGKQYMLCCAKSL